MCVRSFSQHTLQYSNFNLNGVIEVSFFNESEVRVMNTISFEHDWNSEGHENQHKILSYLDISRPEDVGVSRVFVDDEEFVPQEGKMWSLAFARFVAEYFGVPSEGFHITDDMKKMCRDCFAGLPAHKGFVSSFLEGAMVLVLYTREEDNSMSDVQQVIEEAFENRAKLTPDNITDEIILAVSTVLDGLDNGSIRVAEKAMCGEWVVNDWVKKAILLSFKIYDNNLIEGHFTNYYDKIESKYAYYTSDDFQDSGVRVVPPATARRWCYIAPGVVLMPSYTNIGAYIDEGTMIDTWATVGSCAQVGKNCHISGGAGIGGVLEPLQATPTIIEDNCFIGARSEIVEGVIVEKGSVISMGVFIGQSTKIYNRKTGEIIYGRVPAYSVVVPGSLPSDDGEYSLNCAIIVKTVDAKTRERISLNELLRP